jgi:hypothetical protein
LESFRIESLDLQPNLHPVKFVFLISHIASESVIIPHIPLTKLQSHRLVLCPCDDDIPIDESVSRLNVEFATSNELFIDDPLMAIPEQTKSQWFAITSPAVHETH